MASKKIFISYSRSDTEYVSTLVQAFRKQGFDVWFDKNIITGSDWDDTIEEEIKSADALVIILSKASVKSDNVKDEMSFAMSLGKSVNPIKIEDCVIPMRLARKQFLDFTKMGHEAGFERLVKDIHSNLDYNEKVVVEKGTFVPPVKQQINPPVRQRKSSNNWLYIIGGIIIGGGLVVAFVFLLVAIFASNNTEDEPYNNNYSEDLVNTYDDTSNTALPEDQDWNVAYSKNNLDGYIAYLYSYGKPAKYYKQAYDEIKRLLPNTATVWYGTKDGEIHFTKYLYYAGDQTTPPQYDDIITPLFKSEIYEGADYTLNGVFVQPGQKLLVQDVWVDTNNNIWAGVRYDRSITGTASQ